MIDLFLVLFLLGISCVLIVLGFVRRQWSVVIIGSILLGLCGAMIMNGLSYQTGVSVNELNSTVTVVTDNYSVYTGIFRYPISLVLLFSSVGLIIFSIFENNKSKEEADERPMEDAPDE